MKWEIEKLRSKKINALPPLLFLLLLLIPCFIQLTVSQNKRDEQRYLNIKANQVADAQEIERLHQNNGNLNRIETLEEKSILYSQQLESLEKKDYLDQLKAESQLAKIDYEDMLASKQTGQYVDDQKILVTKLDYFIEKEMTVFDPRHSQKLPLVNYFIYFSQLIPSIAVWGMLLLFLSKFFTDEYTDKTVAWNWLTPRKPFKILQQKSWIYWLWMSLSLLLPLVIISVLIAIWNSLGESQYPLFFMDKQQNVSMKLADQYLFQLFIGTFFLVVFLTSLCAFIATICHNYPLTLGIAFGLSLMSTWLSNDTLASSGFYPGNFFQMPKFIIENQTAEIYKMYVSLIALSLIFWILLKIATHWKGKGKANLLRFKQ
ncbi:MAG: hypothetical protein K8V42_04975 [Enterococcus aquimarinus]|uniref:Uncharacterized protein n=1 Tax=Enterococcus aquimarinus TaxID=328396 RepID=A0A9E3ZTZ4_9ENTE|nr:hypothetical protein [Enterococcus aquimarinus]